MSREAILQELPEDFVRQMRDWVRSRKGGDYAMTRPDTAGFSLDIRKAFLRFTWPSISPLP